MANSHVLVIPLPFQSHIIAAMQLVQCLAKHGIKITVVNTDFTHHKLIANAADTPNSIHLVSVPVENFEDIFVSAAGKVKELVEQINASDNDDKITCVIADVTLPWAMEMAAEMGIRRASFSTCAATLLAIASTIPKLIEDGIIGHDGTPTKEQMVQFSPTMPPIKTSELFWFNSNIWQYDKMIFKYALRMNKSINLAERVICNSEYNLEPAAFGMNPKILPIAPLLARNRSGKLVGSFWSEDLSCLKWLDQKPTQSVIYVSFGTTTLLDQTQFQEFAMAFELSKRPFLWVIRPDIANKLDEASLKGFQKKVGDCGRIISWAPQQKVLEHPSIACFISHCGWSSTIESLSSGVPFLCWPFIGDHFHNENHICNSLKVGLAFKRYGQRRIITREEIKTKVEELLENDMYKTNAVNVKEQLINSIKEGGSSFNNFKSCVEWVKG